MFLSASTPGVLKDDKKGENNNNENVQFNGADKLAAGIGGATSIFNTAYDLAQTNDGYDDEIARIRNQAFSPSGTYSLMNQYNNMYLGSPKGWEDFGGKTSGQYAKGILSSTLTGLSTGATIGGGIGAAVGGIVGLGAGAIGMISNTIGAKQNERQYYRDQSNAADFAMGNWNTARNTFASNQFDDALKSFYRSAEYGGLLGTHGSDFSNGIKYINVGGTHEQNPNDGVLMGVDEEGVPNLVEEGEVIFNDYVFSARLKPSKKALNDSLIGDKYLGMTYAEIAEKLAEKSEEMPNDKIEQNTLDANFLRLITIQEEQRAKNEQRQANKFSGGGPMTQNEYNNRISEFKRQARKYASQYAEKGTDNYNKLYESKLAELSADTEREWAEVQASNEKARGEWTERNERLNAIASYMQKNGFKVPKLFDSMSKQERINYNKLEQYYNELVNSGALKPMAGNQDEVAAMEAELEKNYPIDKVVEQVAEEQAAKTAQETVGSTPSSSNPSASATGSSSTANGSGTRAPIREGNVVRPDLTNARVGNGQIQYDRNQNGEEFENQQSNSREKLNAIQPKHLPNEPTLESAMGVKPETLHDTDREWISTYTGPGVEGEEEPKDYSYLLRYAPVLGNALALLGNRKDYSDVHRFEGMTANPRTVRFSPIGTYIRPNLVAPSEMSTPIENQMANERNYISNNSLGNSTASNNYMLASDYLGNSRIGAAYLQGKQYNAEQRQKAAAYNLGIDQYNSEGSFKEQQQNMALNNYYLQRALYDYNMRNNIDMAYNQARSSNLTALFNNLGNIGLDTFNANRANGVFDYYTDRYGYNHYKGQDNG